MRNKRELRQEGRSWHNPCMAHNSFGVLRQHLTLESVLHPLLASGTFLKFLPGGPLALLFLALSSSRESLPIEAEGGGRAAPPPPPPLPLIFAPVIPLTLSRYHECVVDYPSSYSRFLRNRSTLSLLYPSSFHTQEVRPLLSESLLWASERALSLLFFSALSLLPSFGLDSLALLSPPLLLPLKVLD